MYKYLLNLAKIMILFALFFLADISASSDDAPMLYDASVLEYILERVSEETGSSPLIDEIDRYIQNPIYLGTANIEEIIRIPGLTSLQAKRIVALISNNNDCTYQLIESELGLSHEQMYLLRLCTTFDKTKFHKNSILYRIRNQNLLSQFPNLNDSTVAGSKLYLYQKLTANYDNYSIGILTNKTAGEKTIIDFVSGFAMADIYGARVIAGDYYIQSACGNILWQSFGYGKGADVVYSPVQYDNAIKPYSSTIEYDYFRGIAFQKSWLEGFAKGLKSIFWISSIPRSASLDTARNLITSMYGSGYFRTDTELRKRNTVDESAVGGILEAQ